jgi:hypothetical protein
MLGVINDCLLPFNGSLETTTRLSRLFHGYPYGHRHRSTSPLFLRKIQQQISLHVAWSPSAVLLPSVRPFQLPSYLFSSYSSATDDTGAIDKWELGRVHC